VPLRVPATQTIRVFVLALLAATITGCSSAPIAQPLDPSPSEVLGLLAGRWYSTSNPPGAACSDVTLTVGANAGNTASVILVRH